MVTEFILEINSDLAIKSLDFTKKICPTVASYLKNGKQKDLVKIGLDNFNSKIIEECAYQFLLANKVDFSTGAGSHGVDWRIYQKNNKSFSEDMAGVFPNKNYVTKFSVKGCLHNYKFPKSWTFQYADNRYDKIFLNPKLNKIPTPSLELSKTKLWSHVLICGESNEDVFILYQRLLKNESILGLKPQSKICAMVPLRTLFTYNLFKKPIIEKYEDQKKCIYFEDLQKLNDVNILIPAQ